MRVRQVLVPIALSVAALSACARAVVSTAPAPPPVRVGAEDTGLASWYGHPYHGRRTASGEVYDMNEMTAAHRTWPLGSSVIVTNVDSGQAAEVRLNDRGPFIEGRIIDLSYAAASVLGAVGPGVIPVKVRLVALPGAAPASSAAAGPQTAPGAAPASSPSADAFTIQLGAFASRSRADGLRLDVERSGDRPTVTEAVVAGETFYRVRVGPYPDRPAAEAAAERLAARGYRAVVVPGR